jgi:hypothetical protein
MGCTQTKSQTTLYSVTPSFKTDGSPLISILKKADYETKPCTPHLSRRKSKRVSFHNSVEEKNDKKSSTPEMNDVDFFNDMIFQMGMKLHSPAPPKKLRIKSSTTDYYNN